MQSSIWIAAVLLGFNQGISTYTELKGDWAECKTDGIKNWHGRSEWSADVLQLDYWL